MKTIDDRICPPARPILVAANDRLMPGRLCAGKSVAAWACFSYEHAEAVAKWVRDRSEMTHVRIAAERGERRYTPKCDHLHIYANGAEMPPELARLQHLCELAIRNEKDLYNLAMRTFRKPLVRGGSQRMAPYLALAESLARRVYSGGWGAGRDLPRKRHDGTLPDVALRVALEAAAEYRASLLADEPDTTFGEAI